MVDKPGPPGYDREIVWILGEPKMPCKEYEELEKRLDKAEKKAYEALKMTYSLTLRLQELRGLTPKLSEELTEFTSKL